MTQESMAGYLMFILIVITMSVIFITVSKELLTQVNIFREKSKEKFLNNKKNQKSFSWLKVFTFFYILFGFFIFLNPPVKYNNYSNIYFELIWDVRHKLEYKLYAFEIFGFVLLGIIVYVILNKICKKDKNLMNELRNK